MAISRLERESEDYKSPALTFALHSHIQRAVIYKVAQPYQQGKEKESIIVELSFRLELKTYRLQGDYSTY